MEYWTHKRPLSKVSDTETSEPKEKIIQGEVEEVDTWPRLLTGLPSLAKIGSIIAKTKFTRQMENAKNESISIVRFRMRVARSKALDEASKTW